MHYKNKIATILFTLTILTAKISAQPDFSISYQGYYDDNIFNNYENTDDFINNFSLSSAYNVESESNNIQLYYEGNINSFRIYNYKNSNSHRLGIVETYLLGNTNPINAGINFALRNNSDEFKIYDFNQLSAYINYRQLITEGNYFLGGYLFKRNNYKNFPLFSNYEHISFIRWVSEFNSGTSLTLGAEFNYKKYFDSYSLPDYANNSSQIKFASNIYQVISENSGLSFNLSYRINLTDENRYFSDGEYIYYEEEIFNNIYSNDGISLGAEFFQMLNEELLLGIEAGYLTRNFSSLPAADINDGSQNYLREDDLFLTGILLSYDLKVLFEGLTLEGKWNHLYNKSNDYYYDYRNSLISLSINFTY